MSQFTPPTKEEIRKKYDINSADFDVLVSDSLPSAKQLKDEERMLEKVADFFGVPTFFLKSVAGVIIAIIFIPYWGPKVQNEFRECIVTTYSYYDDVLTKKHVPLEQPGFGTDMPRYAVTVRAQTSRVRNAIDLRSGRFPEGSGIRPFSG